MRILALVAPRLAVQLARRADPSLRLRPVATVQPFGGEALVAVPSVEATAAGVQAGMTVAEALGRCPSLAIVAARPAAELDELERLAAVLRVRATPRVALVSRDAIAVDLGGLEGRFGDERAAGEGVLGVARGWLGLDVRGAVADTVEEAVAAARGARRCVVVCEPRGARGAIPGPLTLAARVADPAGLTGERCELALAGLGRMLQAHGASCRGLEVRAFRGGQEERLRLRAEGPLHAGHELVALARPLLAALQGAEAVEFRVMGGGPSVEVEPWRPAVAPAGAVRGPAAPVQPRLALAS
jgi:hypothetical protein